ncbi:MAG: alanine racemase [Propionibacteriaceae bacterium]|nr:alanine racemase [Propionibacteriaceae bacterium]
MATSTVTVRLDHIAANLAAIRARVGDRRVLVAMKADGYGHGAVVVSRHLQDAALADAFGVATVGEGVELREAGIALPILKFSVARGREVAAAAERDLALVAVDEQSIAEAGAAGVSVGREIELHLKIDTGMRRIGCEPEDAPRLAALIRDTPGVRLAGVMSHLPVSDVPSGAEFTVSEIARFRELAEALEADHGPLLKHLANSGGVLAHPDSWLDLVRPGVMAYGNYPDPHTPHTVALLPGLEWRSRVTFVKRVRAGETVGYGRTWTAPADTWLATVAIGYGDGYSRSLSNRGRMLVNGRSYPIAGRVSMDQTMIDLGPEPSAAVGDEVVLIGRSGDEEITVAELAGLQGTITYEVTCAIGRRVAREYRW